MTSKGEAQVFDVASLSDEDRKELLKALRSARKDSRADRTKAVTEAKAAEAKERTKGKRSRKARGQGVSLRPSPKPSEALEQARRSFASCWGDVPENPAVELVALESHLCARINSYSEGKWQHRRVGDDAVVALVTLRDGTQETRRFTRGVIDAEWKRS